jgi:hypothetical protein
MTIPFDQLIHQLQNPDPEQRKQAIMALANTRSPTALGPLGTVYRTDPDPVLRELALKAGRYIRQSSGTARPGGAQRGEAGAAAAAAGASASPGTGSTGTRASQGAREQPRISDRDRELAKSLLDSATHFHIEGDPGRAIENLGKSLALNPEQVKETFVQNLIMTLTGMSVQQALPLLMHPDQREQLILRAGGKRDIKRQQVIDGRVIENVTWNRILIDLGVYWIVSAVSAVITLFFVVDLLRDMIFEMGGQNIFWYSFINELERALSDDIARVILSSLIQSIGSTFTLVILLLVIHYTAVLFFGGEGTMEYFFRRVIPLLTVFTAAMTVVLVVFLLIGSEFTVWFLVPLVMAAGGVGMFVYLADLVGKVYNFGFVSGCISVVLGGFIFGALWNLFFYSFSPVF